MRLKKLSEFREQAFDGKAPTMATLRKWPGVRKIGGECYIDLDALNGTAAQSQPPPDARRALRIARMVRG